MNLYVYLATCLGMMIGVPLLGVIVAPKLETWISKQ